jgi:hypothetical protein
MARRVTWKKGKVFLRRVGRRSLGPRGKYGKTDIFEKGRWEYPNGKKKGRRWRKVR